MCAAFFAVLFAVSPAFAQETTPAPPSLVGGTSSCPTPASVEQRVDRLRAPDGASAPALIVDLGASFRVIAGDRVREFTDEARDCAKRAQFAAVFIAVVAGADPTVARAAPPAPAPVEAVRATPAEIVTAPRVARLRLDLGAIAATGLGGAAPTVAPGLGLRLALGRRRVAPGAGLAVSGPSDFSDDGVAIRQWQVTADAGLRAEPAALDRAGRARPYVELGLAVELLWDRPTNLSLAHTPVSYAVGPRGAAGLRLATRGRLSPFILIQAAWFPGAPQLFALPAGELGHTAPWNLSATAGASWGLL